MTHLLDTDTCIGVLRQRPGMVQRMSQLAPTDCAVSMVTVYELFCGVEKSQDKAKEREKVERFQPLSQATRRRRRRLPIPWRFEWKPFVCSRATALSF